MLHVEDIWLGLPLLAKGCLVTVLLAACSFVLGFASGLVLGLLRQEGPKPLALLSTAYIELIRGVPLILFLVFIHYGLMPLILERTNFWLSSLVALSAFEAAYLGEIVRSGLRSVRRDEREAARSLGLTYRQELMYVVLPLATQRMLPAIVNQLIALVKDTALASIVGVVELTRAGEIIYEQTFHDFEILVFVALVYFLICSGLARLAKVLESSSGAKLPQQIWARFLEA